MREPIKHIYLDVFNNADKFKICTDCNIISNPDADECWSCESINLKVDEIKVLDALDKIEDFYLEEGYSEEFVANLKLKT